MVISNVRAFLKFTFLFLRPTNTLKSIASNKGKDIVRPALTPTPVQENIGSSSSKKIHEEVEESDLDEEEKRVVAEAEASIKAVRDAAAKRKSNTSNIGGGKKMKVEEAELKETVKKEESIRNLGVIVLTDSDDEN